MSYLSYLITLPLLLVIVGLISTIVRTMGRLWLDHRVKLALLEKLEKKPELLTSFEELQELLDNSDVLEPPKRQADLLLTGILLALAGAICAVIFANVGRGQTAVGAYIGGVACVALGFLLTVAGLIVRIMARPPRLRGTGTIARLRGRLLGSDRPKQEH